MQDTKERVALTSIAASGGLSHFVVDEEFDRCLLKALQDKDAETLKSLPRERLFSATSESLNWVAVGGAMQDTDLKMDLLDYVPVYRSPAATGGGWAFARWYAASKSRSRSGWLTSTCLIWCLVGILTRFPQIF